MIRPVLFVDLPRIIYAIDRRARIRQHEFANFVCWLEPVEDRLPPPSTLQSILPLNTASRTWICEDHWRLLGFAQIYERPARTAWELSYLASMANRSISDEEILTALLEYTLEMAASRGILRMFAKVDEEIPEFDLFQRSGFQRYARELTYVYQPGSTLPDAPSLPSLRRWTRHHAWGLHQLYRSVAPQRVQMAELLESSDEYAKLNVGSQRWLTSLFSWENENYVCDVGVRLGAWLRITRGSGSTPHRIFIQVHPEHADLAEPLLRFGIRRLLEADVRRIYCLVREYDSCVITALRNSGFEQTSLRVLLVRHVALLATRQSTVPLLEQRAVYGLKGLGTVNSRQKIMR
jgi:GNAT superfamily N-acetyltransferase